MILIDKGESAVGLDAVRKIGIAAGDEDEIAFQFAFRIYWAGAIDAGMKAVVRAQFGEERAFGENFRSGGGDGKVFGGWSVGGFSGVERIKPESRICLSQLR